ncbi:MAG: hypothetical protein IPM76_12405 [Chloroflexi bacterium]|nr:hypothetical protein [Chloroflexota bacterium]
MDQSTSKTLLAAEQLFLAVEWSEKSFLAVKKSFLAVKKSFLAVKKSFLARKNGFWQ